MIDRTRTLAALLAIAIGASALAGAATVGADDGTHLDHDELTLEAGPGQVVAGESALAAGTKLSIRIQSTGESPFLMTVSTTVDRDGRFRAVFDLSDVDPEAPVEVVVHHDGDELASAAGEVVACTDACETEPPADPASETTLEYDGDRLELTADSGNAIYGRTSLPPGTTLSVRIQSSGDSPFLMNRGAVVDENGQFRAVFDLWDVPPDASFRVTVIHDGTDLAAAAGTVECVGDCETPTPEPSSGDPTTVATTMQPLTVTDETAGNGSLLPGVGALAVGALLAVVGIGLVVGAIRL